MSCVIVADAFAPVLDSQLLPDPLDIADNQTVSLPARPISAALSIVVLGAVVLFLAALAYLTAYGYLLPTAHSAGVDTQPISAVPVKARHAIGAYSGLLLTLVLLDVAFACLLAYRVIRYLRPKRPPVRVKTTVIDAWAEAGKRLEESDEP